MHVLFVNYVKFFNFFILFLGKKSQNKSLVKLGIKLI